MIADQLNQKLRGLPDNARVLAIEDALEEAGQVERDRVIGICKALWQQEVDSMAGTPPGSDPQFNDGWTPPKFRPEEYQDYRDDYADGLVAWCEAMEGEAPVKNEDQQDDYEQKVRDQND